MKIPIFEAQTEWIEPEEYPDLRSYDEIAIDLETRDPELKTRGSGSVIGLGEVVGIAVAVPGRKFYLLYIRTIFKFTIKLHSNIQRLYNQK